MSKGVDQSQISRQQLTVTEPALNHRQREIRGFLSPPKVFSKMPLNLIGGVALQA